MSKLALSIIIIVVLAVLGFGYVMFGRNNPIFSIQPTPTPAYSDLIQVTKPLPGEGVNDPIIIEGKARGNWYFEASFPVEVKDADDKLVAGGIATAKGDWMTEDFVPFRAELKFFVRPTTVEGTLVLRNDNPSGLPENEKEVRIPIVFNFVKRTISLYYYNPENDRDASGNIMCSKQGLVEVSRNILRTVTPIQDAVNLLLRGELTKEEKEQGITTEFPLAGVLLVGAVQKGGVLTLEFKDEQNKTGGGSCRVGILWAQIEATAKQFGATKVRFIPEELFQP